MCRPEWGGKGAHWQRGPSGHLSSGSLSLPRWYLPYLCPSRTASTSRTRWINWSQERVTPSYWPLSLLWAWAYSSPSGRPPRLKEPGCKRGFLSLGEQGCRNRSVTAFSWTQGRHIKHYFENAARYKMDLIQANSITYPLSTQNENDKSDELKIKMGGWIVGRK